MNCILSGFLRPSSFCTSLALWATPKVDDNVHFAHFWPPSLKPVLTLDREPLMLSDAIFRIATEIHTISNYHTWDFLATTVHTQGEWMSELPHKLSGD